MNKYQPVIDKWESLTLEERKVEIAKDILLQIDSNFYHPTWGTYFDLKKESWNLTIQNEEDNFQNLLIEDKIECEMCALGACLISLIRFENKISCGEIITGGMGFIMDDSDCEIKQEDPLRIRLRDLFGSKQIGLIETAFENFERYGLAYKCSHEEVKAAIDFGNKYDTHREKLIAIMQNIIDNNGTFIP